MTLQEYVQATEAAIFQNPPRNQPQYSADPKAVWRYYVRQFGHGLDAFDPKECAAVIQTLYSRWFVRLELHSKMPNIDAKEFFGWIREAEAEAREKKAAREARQYATVHAAD